MIELRVAGESTCQLIQAEPEGLTEDRAIGGGIVTPPWIGRGQSVDLVPGHIVLAPVVVTGLKGPGPVEIELPLVLAHLAGRRTTPNPVAHVIVDLAIVDPGSQVAVYTVSRPAPLALDHIGFLGNEMVDRNAVEGGSPVVDIANYPGPHGA